MSAAALDAGAPAPRAAWALFYAGLVLAVAAAALAAALTVEGGADANAIARATVRIGSAAVLLPVGLLVLARAPGNPLGPIFAAGALGGLLAAAAAGYATYSHEVRALAGEDWAGWIGEWANTPIFLIPAVALLLFPDGRPLGPRWRPWVATGAAGTAAIALLGFFGPPEDLDFATNPLTGAADGGPIEALSTGWLALIAATGAGIACLVRRARASVGVEREQVRVVLRAARWVLAGFVVCTVQQAVLPGFDGGAMFFTVSLAAIAVAMAVAILRHRLYGLDVYVDRALVGTATAVVLGLVYALAVVAIGALFDADASIGVALPAMAAVAVALAPVRDGLQRGVERLLHGQRDEPYEAIATLGERLDSAREPADVLPVLVATIADALRLPYVAVELADGAVVTAGAAAAGVALRLPLVHAGDPVGTLVIGARAHGEALGPADRRLLEQFARSAAAAAGSVALSAEVQRSRERLVSAREEERRRLRGDLHDGLGPTLAGAVLTIEAARRVLRSDPDAADELLDRAAESVEGTVADVRRVVYALRPPALDQLGLAGALSRHAATLSGGGRLRCEVVAPDPFPALPAATEVAAYRIAQEALTNVVRHAGARTATVTLELREALRLEVRDDGVGLPAGHRSGVGLESMRERAGELGGTFAIDSGPGGTTIAVTLPLAGAPAGRSRA